MGEITQRPSGGTSVQNDLHVQRARSTPLGQLTWSGPLTSMQHGFKSESSGNPLTVNVAHLPEQANLSERKASQLSGEAWAQRELCADFLPSRALLTLPAILPAENSSQALRGWSPILLVFTEIQEFIPSRYIYVA